MEKYWIRAFQPEGVRSDYRYIAEKDLGFLVRSFTAPEKHEIKSRKEKPASLMLIAVMRQRMDSPETVFSTVTKWLKRQIGKSGVIK